MKTNFLKIFIITMSFLTTACQKVDNSLADNDKYNKSILKFRSFGEFKTIYEEHRNLQNNELNSALKSAFNFSSFSEEADEFYESINIEAFANKEEAEAFIHLNPKYLHIHYDTDNAMHVEPLLADNPFRIYINEDRLFQIGDTVMRVFEDAVLGTKASNINMFLGVTEHDIYQLIHHSDVFTFYSHNTELNMKDGAHYCGVAAGANNIVDNEKIELGLWVAYVHLGGNGLFPATNQWTYFSAKPYKKWAGIWWNVKRTIKCNIKVATAYYIYNNYINWVRIAGSFNSNGTLTNNLNSILTEQWISNGYWALPIAHMDGINAWAKQTNTGNATISCNSQLVP